MQLYMSEIFPTRIREGGIAVGAATQWLFGFTLSQITPAAVNNLGYKAFLMFCCFNWALVLYTWFFIKETKGLSLEEMEICKFSFPSPIPYIDQFGTQEMKANESCESLFLPFPKKQCSTQNAPQLVSWRIAMMINPQTTTCDWLGGVIVPFSVHFLLVMSAWCEFQRQAAYGLFFFSRAVIHDLVSGLEVMNNGVNQVSAHSIVPTLVPQLVPVRLFGLGARARERRAKIQPA